MTSPTRAHLTGLDGLRGLAALSVLGYHVSNVLSPGVRGQAPELVFALHQGLNLFFVLSGFLLFLGFAERLIDGRDLPSLRRYASNRALRLWPAYLVVLVVTDRVAGLSFVWPRGIGRLDPATFAADLTLLQTFTPGTIRTGLEVAWTLTVELTFYASLPLLAFLARRLGRRLGGWARAALPVLCLFLLGAAGLAWKFAAAPHGWSQSWESVASRSLFAHAQLFALGMVATLVYVAAQRGLIGRRGRRILRFVALAVVLSAAAVCLADRRSELADTVAASGFAALILVCVVPVSLGGAGSLGRALEWAPLRGLGLISFSVYLWHMPVIRGLDQWAPGLGDGGRWDYLGAVVLVTGVTVALATTTYLLVERPAMRLRSRAGRPRRREGRHGIGRPPLMTIHDLGLDPSHAVDRTRMGGSEPTVPAAAPTGPDATKPPLPEERRLRGRGTPFTG